MHLLSATTFWLVVVGICGENYSELGELVKRIHKEIDLATVNFIGIDNEYLSVISESDFNIPVTIFTYFPSDLNEFEWFDENIILVLQVEKARSQNVQYLEVLEKFILRLRVRKFVVIIANNLELLVEYFQYFHDKKFTRIFGIAECIPIVYLPYADSSVQQLSKSIPLPDALRDLNGFKIRTTVQMEIPRVFWYKDKHGQRKIGGYVAQLFLSFLLKHNASFTEIFINNSSELYMPGVFNAIANGDVDISMNTYSPLEGFESSYPIKFLSWTILVPLNGYVDSYQYFIRPFTGTVWIFIGLTLVYIILMDFLKDYYANVPINLWVYISRTFLKLLAMSSEKKISSAYRFHCQVLVFAFILVNLYTIHLTSFLTVFIKIKQFDTIKDLIENNIPIMMADYEWFSLSHPERQRIEKIVVLVDASVHNRERDSMTNTSFAYPVGKDKAEFLMGLQRNLARPRFHMIPDSLLEYYLVFVLSKHSPFHEILDNCIIQIADTGLMQKWTHDAARQGFHAGLVDVESSFHRLSVPLTLHHLQFAWSCLLLGSTVALGVFVGEKWGEVLRNVYLKI